MKTLQNCIHLQDEKSHSAKQSEGLRRGKIPVSQRYSQSLMCKCQAGILLLHNAIPESRKQNGSGNATSRDSRTASHPGSDLRTHHRENATRSTGQLIAADPFFLRSVNFTPLRWCVGMSGTISIALNRFKMRRQEISTKRELFLILIINRGFLSYICPVDF